MIVNGITVVAALAGVSLAIGIAAWLMRGTSAPQARRDAMRKGTHPAGKRHVTEGKLPTLAARDAGHARRMARTWHHLADMALETAYTYDRMGASRAAYEAAMRADEHRTVAHRWDAMARTAGQTGRTVDVRI